MQYRPHRYPTQFPIQLLTPQGRQQCRVMDVNSRGARIVNAAPIRRGDKVRFRILNDEVAAVVCWVKGNNAGLTFRPPITPFQVDTLRYRRDAPQGRHRGGIGFSSAEM
ncbi:PilZ domain-containing protein [Yoonia sp.]|uniref:PilZ domain-containing protein n=1 Tax=Yoonia sp. TaxID=2212373 RepID=UPI00358EC2BB